MQQRISFQSRRGHRLAGIIHIPDTREVAAYALFAHCFTCTKNINSATNIADALSQQGIATLRFDFTGLGASKGDFADSSFTTNIEDLIDAAGFLQENYQAPQLIVGHSLGGTAILAAAKDIPSAKAVATIGSPASPEHMLHLLESNLQAIEQQGSAEVDLAGRAFTFKQEFVDDIRQHSIDLKKLGKALMVMHSPIDDTVSIDQAGSIFSQAMHPKSFVTLDKADHLLANAEDSQYAGKLLASWAMRYIETIENKNLASEGVISNAKTAQGFLCNINANGHHLVADEPLSVGGTNLGPSPYDYLATALGTCTAMTLNMYARHKKLDVSDVSVTVEHNRIHADDCVDCEKQAGQIDVFTRKISIEGNLDEAQSQRMLQIADRCPVHKTLENEIKIETALA
jgi:uncharacterized OsmC-like protein/alpha/beta superfamily hydrolase